MAYIAAIPPGQSRVAFRLVVPAEQYDQGPLKLVGFKARTARCLYRVRLPVQHHAMRRVFCTTQPDTHIVPRSILRMSTYTHSHVHAATLHSVHAPLRYTTLF